MAVSRGERSAIEIIPPKSLQEIAIAIVFFNCGAFMYIPFGIIVLEPLGYLDKHVSKVPEGQMVA